MACFFLIIQPGVFILAATNANDIEYSNLPEKNRTILAQSITIG